MNAMEIKEMVIAGLTEEGTFNHAEFKEVMKLLAAERTARKGDAKQAIKDAKEATKAELAVVGKAYVETLAVGDAVSYTMADGTVMEGTIAENKAGAKTQHIILNEIPEGSKKADRYVAYDKIVVPTDFAAAA